jgi:hypothetical protein
MQHLFDHCKAMNSLMVLGALQLHPPNHGRNFHLEELALEFLKQVEKNKGLRPPAWTELEAVIPTCGQGGYLQPPMNPFTTNVIFRNGSNIVYPGIYNHGTHILNEIILVLHSDKALPEAFVKIVSAGITLMLEISHQISLELDHPRHMDVVNESGMIEFPTYQEGIKIIRAITFSKEQMNAICNEYHIDPSLINEFLVPLDPASLQDDDPEGSIVSTRPLVNYGNDICVYSPTTIVSSLISFAFRQAEAHHCKSEFVESLQGEQLYVAQGALNKMSWSLTDIKLPTQSGLRNIDEFVCKFDNQKLAYVCFLRTEAYEQEPTRSVELLRAHKKDVCEFLRKLNPDQPHDVFTLYLYPDIGETVFWKWDKPEDENYSLMFGVHELQMIASRETADALTLWKFAKALYRAGEKVKFLCAGGLTELYAIFEHNDGSLLHPTKVTGINGVQPIESDYAAPMFRAHYVRRDEHALITKLDETVGFFSVTRHHKHAPVYHLTAVNDSPFLILDHFKMPLWFKIEQQNSKNSRWARHIADAIAFWLWRINDELGPLLEKQSFIKFDFEIVVDPTLDESKDFVIKDFPDNVEIKIETAPMRIRLQIPFDFIYVAWKADNSADRLLVKAALTALVQYIREAGREIDLGAEDMDRIIEKTMVPSSAKMVLFNDSSYDVRLDNRNLPSLRFIPQADDSYVLENIVTWLSPGYSIPPDLADVEQKKKLFNDLVAALVDRITKELQPFNGQQLLEWLLRLHERCTETKEFRELLIPARIASFSEFDREVEKLLDEAKNLVATAHALRTLIEFVATKIPTGTKWANYDDIDELLAMVHQLTNFGALADAITFGFTNPKVGLLPSGRIGIDKTFEREVLTPFSEAKAEASVLGYVEHFESKYQASHRKEETQAEPDSELDEAFFEEFGIQLPHLIKIVCALRDSGFEQGQGFIRIPVSEVNAMLAKKYPDISEAQRGKILTYLTLLERDGIGKPPDGYGNQDIFPWRYNRGISYLRRPLVRYKDEKGNEYLYYGYRHLVTYLEHLFYLLFNGKLPERTSEKMRTFQASILGEKGTPFRNQAKKWFKENTKFQVIEYQVSIFKLSRHEPDKKLGDIDLLVIDHENKIVYPIECKHKTGARNMMEMKRELDDFFGRNGGKKNAKLLKHENRDAWLKKNRDMLKSLFANPETYTVSSLVLSAEEIAVGFLATSLTMPIVLFNQLKLKGVAVLRKPDTI